MKYNFYDLLLLKYCGGHEDAQTVWRNVCERKKNNKRLLLFFFDACPLRISSFCNVLLQVCCMLFFRKSVWSSGVNFLKLLKKGDVLKPLKHFLGSYTEVLS